MGGTPFMLDGPVSVTYMYLTPTHAWYSTRMSEISSTGMALNQLRDGLIQARYILNAPICNTCKTLSAHVWHIQLTHGFEPTVKTVGFKPDMSW